MAICVCGEGLVDLVPVSPGSLNDHVPALGGGPYNVAVTASRLGADVVFQSRLSTDGFGNELVKHLETEGVDTTYVQRGPEPTILAVTTIHEDRSATYAPTEQRPRLLLHGAWQRFLIFSHNVIGHKQISFAFHPLLARTGHTSQLRILRKEQLSPALRLRLKILIGHSSR